LRSPENHFLSALIFFRFSICCLHTDLEMEKAQHFAEEELRVAERLDDAARLVGAHMGLGLTLYYQGKLGPALAHFRRGFELFDPNMQFPD
jgi:hypothetical protein